MIRSSIRTLILFLALPALAAGAWLKRDIRLRVFAEEWVETREPVRAGAIVVLY